jgi:hypothetical protein
MSCLKKNTDDIDLICGIWVHSDQLQIKFTFRSGPMIFGILQIWYTHLWHQHISEITDVINVDVMSEKNTDVINIAVMSEKHWCHKCCCHVWKTDIGVLFTWHLHSRHQCFSDISATFMTSVLFRHDIYIHDLSVFFFRHDVKIHWCHRCRCHVWKTMML